MYHTLSSISFILLPACIHCHVIYCVCGGKWCIVCFIITQHQTTLQHLAHATFCNIHRQSSMVHPVCMCDLALTLNPGWIQCLSLVCHWWPSCRCRVPCPQDGGPPLWPWWCWIHSPTLGILPGSLVRGGVPCAILWLWRESKGQSWYMLVWLNITWMSASVSNA